MKKAPRLRAVLGQRIRELRQSRGLTLEALGERAKIDDKYLQSVETARQAATVDVVEKIAAGLGVSPAALFSSEEGSTAAVKTRIAATLRSASPSELKRIAKVLDALWG